MIRRYILHLEFHWGYRPRISFRRKPRPGDRVMDGGVLGKLITCETCSGDGLLFQSDPPDKLIMDFPKGGPDREYRVGELLTRYGATYTVESVEGLKVTLARYLQPLISSQEKHGS
jgi:hypothetical protein